jgi:hypothetical protein
MASALGKGLVVAAVGLAAWLIVSAESFTFALWVFDNEPGCRAQTTETCAFNAVAAAVVAGVAGLVTLFCAVLATAFVAAGRRGNAKAVLVGLGALLALGHLWLLL